MITVQPKNQPVDITKWGGDNENEFDPYPEGARDKTLVYSPAIPPYCFLKANHQYLFKLSRDRCPEQFWVEIFAYQLGVHMDISVPATFVAYNDTKKQCAALIEWFLFSSSSVKEEFESGGDLCQQRIPNFDQKRGKQHNFETISRICQDLQDKNPTLNFDWKMHWAKTFLFDALIGNKDRHQSNWGIIRTWEYGEAVPSSSIKEIRISPVFDNGTSMGYEFPSNKFEKFNDVKCLEKYVLNGRHHMKWRVDDEYGMHHSEMLTKYASIYPETRQIMLNCLRMVNDEIFKKILSDLTKFDVPVKLTPGRANFMLKLINFRHQRLQNELDK